MNMTFSIFLVGAPILVGARGSCPICPMVNDKSGPADISFFQTDPPTVNNAAKDSG